MFGLKHMTNVKCMKRDTYPLALEELIPHRFVKKT